MRSRGQALSRCLARLFRWLFPCAIRRLIPIERRRGRPVRHGVGDRGDSILPTSPRPIEGWS